MKIIKQQVPLINHPVYKFAFGLANDKRTWYRLVVKVIRKHKRYWGVLEKFNRYDYRDLKTALSAVYREEEIKPCMYWK